MAVWFTLTITQDGCFIYRTIKQDGCVFPTFIVEYKVVRTSPSWLQLYLNHVIVWHEQLLPPGPTTTNHGRALGGGHRGWFNYGGVLVTRIDDGRVVDQRDIPDRLFAPGTAARSSGLSGWTARVRVKVGESDVDPRPRGPLDEPRSVVGSAPGVVHGDARYPTGRRVRSEKLWLATLARVHGQNWNEISAGIYLMLITH